MMTNKFIIRIIATATNPSKETPTDSPPENPQAEDLGAQRFPTSNFASFDDLWDSSDLKYKTFNYQFSKVTPEKFICAKENNELWKFPLSGYEDGKGPKIFP